MNMSEQRNCTEKQPAFFLLEKEKHRGEDENQNIGSNVHSILCDTLPKSLLM